jgi:catechol-2,3-dioxygenase
MPPPLEFSHIGFFVADLDKTQDFYTRVLGFPITDEGLLGTQRLTFLSRNPKEHHQVVLVEGRPRTLPFNVINQISFRAQSIAELRTIYHSLEQEPDVSELVAVTHGIAVSLYCKDPEGNRIEIFVDCPWYVEQPLRVVIDIDLPEQEILDGIRAHIQDHPTFRPMADWSQQLAQHLDTMEK